MGVGAVLRKSWEWESPLPWGGGLEKQQRGSKRRRHLCQVWKDKRLLSDGEVMGSGILGTGKSSAEVQRREGAGRRRLGWWSRRGRGQGLGYVRWVGWASWA